MVRPQARACCCWACGGRWPPGSLNVWSGQALDGIHKGKITDGKSIIVLYWGEKYLAGEWNP